METQLPIDNCLFEKTNLITKPGGYDEYTCQTCGIKGRRYGISAMITTRDVCKKNNSLDTVFISKRIRIVSHNVKQFGLAVGDELDTVDIPDHYKDSMLNSTWVFSVLRDEPVCLLRREFEVI